MTHVLAFIAALAAPTTFDSHPLSEPYYLTEADEKVVKGLVGQSLKDPYSAEYRFGPAFDEYIYCGTVNAKNEFGAYSGPKLFAILYVRGRTRFIADAAELDPLVVVPMCDAVNASGKALVEKKFSKHD